MASLVGRAAMAAATAVAPAARSAFQGAVHGGQAIVQRFGGPLATGVAVASFSAGVYVTTESRAAEKPGAIPEGAYGEQRSAMQIVSGYAKEISDAKTIPANGAMSAFRFGVAAVEGGVHGEVTTNGNLDVVKAGAALAGAVLTGGDVAGTVQKTSDAYKDTDAISIFTEVAGYVPGGVGIIGAVTQAVNTILPKDTLKGTRDFGSAAEFGSAVVDEMTPGKMAGLIASVEPGFEMAAAVVQTSEVLLSRKGPVQDAVKAADLAVGGVVQSGFEKVDDTVAGVKGALGAAKDTYNDALKGAASAISSAGEAISGAAAEVKGTVISAGASIARAMDPMPREYVPKGGMLDNILNQDRKAVDDFKSSGITGGESVAAGGATAQTVASAKTEDKSEGQGR